MGPLEELSMTNTKTNTGLKVRSSVKAGGFEIKNHNRALKAI